MSPRLVPIGALISLATLTYYGVELLAWRVVVTPWYLPAGTALGFALALMGIRSRRGVLRIVTCSFLALIAVGGTGLVLFSELPEMSDQVTVGQPLPPLNGKYWDGRDFSTSELASVAGSGTLIVFYRGRW